MGRLFFLGEGWGWCCGGLIACRAPNGAAMGRGLMR